MFISISLLHHTDTVLTNQNLYYKIQTPIMPERYKLASYCTKLFLHETQVLPISPNFKKTYNATNVPNIVIRGWVICLYPKHIITTR